MKQKLFFILTLGSSLFINLQAQVTGLSLDSASILILSGKYPEAGHLLLKRCLRQEKEWTDTLSTPQKQLFFSNLYSLVCCYAKTGQTDSALHFLELLADHHYAQMQLLGDVDLESLHASPRWKPVLDKIRSSFMEVNKGIGKPGLALELEELEARDQSVRMNNRISPERAQEINDSNKLRVTAILDRYGYPGPAEVGPEASRIPVLILIHADLKTQQKYLGIIKKAVKQQKLNGEYLGVLIDKIQIALGKPQIYGTQFRRNPATGKNEPYPVKHPDRIEKERSRLGFPMTYAEYKSFQESF